MEKELTQFLEFINEFVPLTFEDVEHVLPSIKLIEFDRKELILGVDEKCKDVFFVIEGLFRIYNLKDGNEINMAFMSEGEFFTDYESLVSDENCKCYIESIEKTRMLLLPYDKLLEGYDKSHMLERLGRLMVERAMTNMISLNNSAANIKAEQKYTEFEENNKELVNRIPLKHLASFIGITPESLSRLRKSRLESVS